MAYGRSKETAAETEWRKNLLRGINTEKPTYIMDGETCAHLSRWCQNEARDYEEEQTLFAAIKNYCETNDYDPCANGAAWPTLRTRIEMEKR
jgi:hypothetical protein